MKTLLLSTSEQDISAAGAIIRSGGLVAFPTETVYGLGANALDENAVKSIYAAKGRPSDNPLIVHVAKKEDIAPLVQEITPQAKALIDAFFPAPLTVILPKSDIIPNATSGGLGTVAIRMPQNEVARAVIAAAGVPVAAPSANTSGLPSPTKAKYVIDDMFGKVDAIIDGGDCAVGVESTVITLATDTPTILRPGAITKEMIESVIGKVEIASAVLGELGENETAASPGMKYKHYAPKAEIVIVDADKTAYENFVNTRENAFALCFDDDNVTIPHITYGSESDDSEQARELFDALRKLDEIGARRVYARMPHKDGVAMAVYNRLIRAAAFRVIDLKKPFTIGLTGATGAGKGYVCEQLKARGFNIIDTDKIAREVVQKGSPLLTELAATFGGDIIKNGELDRALLAERAFADKSQTAKLNAIMHPAIIKRCIELADGLTVLDAPQLFEANAQDKCYKIVAVTAPKELRIKRITARDGITAEQAKQRVAVQFDDEYYKAHSDFVIVNDGGDITGQINNILDTIL
ncbi:MAG: threonylcarbamoyl-AMP synthase [Eubacterium sp.]|nr:threonylcarbamoyl-AMP synthase [Eubacterium sp.]